MQEDVERESAGESRGFAAKRGVLTTTPYHAMGNGLVERVNGVLKKMLKRMCVEQAKIRPRFIDPLSFAYRKVPQASTKFSPLELLYGHSVRGPLASLRELWGRS